MKRQPIDPRVLSVTAVMTAIVFVTTRIVLTVTPDGGYIHLGEAAILFSAFAFGPWVGAVAGGLGTALADLSAGFTQWAIFSLIIHGTQGWVVGWLAERWPGNIGLVSASIIGGLIVVVGYVPAGMIILGIGPALYSILFNIVQVALGGVVSVLLFVAVRRAYPPIVNMGRRR